MADFLTHLAERTLGVAPVARPVLTPLFAPPVATGRAEQAIAQHVGSSPDWESAPQEVSAQPQPVAQIPDEGTVPPLGDEVLIEQAEPTHPNPAPGELSVTRESFERETQMEAPASQAVDPDHAPATRTWSRKRSRSEASESVNSKIIHALQPEQAHLDQQFVAETTDNTAPVRSQSVKPQILPPSDLPGPPTAPVRRGNRQDLNEPPVSGFPPEVQPARSRQTDDGTLQRQEQAAPVIRVSIDRIEVRAVSAPAPAPHPTPVPPRLSLDEYLRGLNGNRP